MQHLLPTSGKSSQFTCLQKTIHYCIPVTFTSSLVWHASVVGLKTIHPVYGQLRLRVCQLMEIKYLKSTLDYIFSKLCDIFFMYSVYQDTDKWRLLPATKTQKQKEVQSKVVPMDTTVNTGHEDTIKFDEEEEEAQPIRYQVITDHCVLNLQSSTDELLPFNYNQPFRCHGITTG